MTVTLPAGRTWHVPSRASSIPAALLVGVAAGAAVSLVNPVYALLAFLAVGVAAALCLLPMGRLWLLAGIITLLPFAVIPVNFGVKLGLLDVISALLLGVALVRFLARTQAGVGTPLDLPILLYVGLCCVAFILGFGVTAVDGESARYFLKIVVAMLLFFVVTNTLVTRDRLSSFITALALGSFGAALLAVLLQLVGPVLAARLLSALGPLGYPSGSGCTWDPASGENVCGVLRYVAGTSIWRATSTSIDPNIFCGLVMVGMLLLLGRLLARPSKRGWRLGLPMLAIMAAALLLSYSRGAWVGLAAGVLVLAVLRYRRALPAILLAGVVVVLILGQTEFGRHLVAGFLLEDRATAMRVGEYKDALDFISQYPLFGVGYGFYSQWRTGIHLPGEVYVGVSNIYLLLTLEVGLVGMAGFLAVLGTLAAWAIRRYRVADREGQIWLASLGATLSAAAVAGLADHYFVTYPHMAALFWCLIGALAVAARLASPAAAPNTAGVEPPARPVAGTTPA